MIKPMTYNGYTAKIEYDAECNCFLGEVLDLNDIITFSGSTPDELKQALKDSIEAYVEYCKETGEAPEKPFSGKFSVRIEPELHKAVSRYAALTGKSVNAFVSDALTVATEQRVAPSTKRGSNLDT
jgi:predicted HicB family RNase H-like nuclease